MVCFIDVGRALWGLLQVGTTLRWVHVSGSGKEALQEGALTCNMHLLSRAEARKPIWKKAADSNCHAETEAKA
jgi:hypothetical protein